MGWKKPDGTKTPPGSPLEPAYAEIHYDGGWSAIVNDLEIVQLAGDHLAVVDEPEISKVGRALTERISRISHM